MLIGKPEFTFTQPRAPDLENNEFIPPTASGPKDGVQRIDLDAALLIARSTAKNTEPKNLIELQTKRGLTVESAVARALAPNVFAETRGASNEWVYRDGKTTCIIPTQVPVFLQGVTTVPLCTTSK